MRKSWLMCVLLGTLAWGQAAPGTPPPAQPSEAPADTSAAVPPGAAVITVNGVCSDQSKTSTTKAAAAKPASTAKAPAAKVSAADCKTVITKAEFEKLANAVAPNVTPQLKKQLAGVLPRLIAMSSEAKKQGLDKSPKFEETVKFAKMQILTNELQRKIQEEAANVPPAEVENYYKGHPETFEQFSVDRLFVPRSKQTESDTKEDEEKDEKVSEEAQKAKQAEEKAKADEAEQAMTKLAESLRARAAAGEEFAKLQKEAFDAAGMKVESPTVSLPNVRRTGLPPGHAAIFDLKPGDVSQVINDSGGHYIYKMNGKSEIPLDQAKTEIHSTLQNQRTREMMDKINGSFKVESNEAYFGPGGVGSGPPPHLPHPRVPSNPPAPAAQPQTPPPAQAPTAKPN